MHPCYNSLEALVMQKVEAYGGLQRFTRHCDKLSARLSDPQDKWLVDFLKNYYRLLYKDIGIDIAMDVAEHGHTLEKITALFEREHKQHPSLFTGFYLGVIEEKVNYLRSVKYLHLAS